MNLLLDEVVRAHRDTRIREASQLRLGRQVARAHRAGRRARHDALVAGWRARTEIAKAL